MRRVSDCFRCRPFFGMNTSVMSTTCPLRYIYRLSFVYTLLSAQDDREITLATQIKYKNPHAQGAPVVPVVVVVVMAAITCGMMTDSKTDNRIPEMIKPPLETWATTLICSGPLLPLCWLSLRVAVAVVVLAVDIDAGTTIILPFITLIRIFNTATCQNAPLLKSI